VSLSASPVQSLKGRYAALHRDHKPGSPEILEAGAELAAAKIQQYIERVVAEAPPLTADQRSRIAALLGGAS
jgi:hypothetical protein